MPMTPEEQERATNAQRLRDEIETTVSDIGANFLDRSPVLGAINPIAAPMSVSSSTDSDGVHRVLGEVVFGGAYEGAPGCAHGGFISAYFDEVLGVAQAMTGNPGMTVNLTVDYRSPTPIRKPLQFRGHVVSHEGRKIHTYGSLHHGEILCAEATAIFVSMRPEVFERLLKLRAEQEG